MARKVFISFLGTNNYVDCKYSFANTISEPVRFVQEALVAQICKEWTEKDKILIFCTSKEKTGENGSKEINWVDNTLHLENGIAEVVGLKHKLDDIKVTEDLRPMVEEIDIDAGFSEDEIWNIFNTVYNHLQPGDQIYFDVTHAFRSIPLFSVVLFNYSKFLIGTQIKMIVYGAFEKLGPTYKVKDMPVEKRIAPIVDLTNIARLQEYNQIASGLKEFGKVKQIKNAISNSETQSTDQTLRDLSSSITELDEYIATIDLKNIKSGKYVTKFRNSYRCAKRKLKLVEPISNILEELYQETKDFVSENSFQNIEAAINWTIKHDMLMQTYPLAEEYIILRIADMLSDMRPSRMSSKDFRKFTSSLLGMPSEDFDTKNWKDLLAEYPDSADAMSEDFLIKELRPEYDKIRRARNSLAHGNGSVSYQDLRKLIPVIIDSLEHLNAAYTNYSSSQYIIKSLC